MASMKLKIILHSANDLKNVKSMGTMSPYAMISMANSGKFRTSSITNGGSNPVWNESMIFNTNQDECMEENQVITFEIYCGGIEFDRTIGQVKVSLKHLLLRHACGDKVRYPLMTTSGGKEGSILISYILSIVSEGSGVVDDMASKKLTLKIHFAENLNDVKILGVMNPYARIRMSGEIGSYRTPTAKDGGRNPHWYSSIDFNLDQYTYTQDIIVEMFHDGTLSNRPIDKVLIPLENLLGQASGERVKYPVIGEGTGKITVSYNISFVSKGISIGTQGSMVVDESDEGVSICKVLKIAVKVIALLIDVGTTVIDVGTTVMDMIDDM